MTSPIAYSLKTAAVATGMSEPTLARAIHAGRLRAKKSGQNEAGEPTGSWVIPAASLQAYIDGLVDA